MLFFKNPVFLAPLLIGWPIGLKLVKNCKIGKQSVAHQPALRVHNAQNRDKRGEEVFCLAPKAAVTHGLSVNYTWVTAVTNSNVTDGLKTCEKLQNRKTKRCTSALSVHNAQNRDKGVRKCSTGPPCSSYPWVIGQLQMGNSGNRSVAEWDIPYIYVL